MHRHVHLVIVPMSCRQSDERAQMAAGFRRDSYSDLAHVRERTRGTRTGKQAGKKEKENPHQHTNNNNKLVNFQRKTARS
jgi:hypothetical protein